ncbi:hypothetical protein EON83_00205 [bacterium]|nr:MAG: hypothetical protein EON83_00205 [bacterium]
MSVRSPFFRKSQTDLCNRISEPPQKGFDDHNPPGSMFRERQTLHIYGTLRTPYAEPETQLTPTIIPAPPSPQIETPQDTTIQPTYQASEFLAFDLTHLTSRRLCIMGAIRLIERAIEIGDTDGIPPKALRPYATNARNTTKRFERTIKPKSPLGFLKEKLLED